MAQLMTAADAARLLGVVPATVRQMHRDGRLPAIRTEGGIRLFAREDVLQFLAERQERARTLHTLHAHHDEEHDE
ncbi:MAG: helix-turn-helix domain-containing protein [Thermomicrobiales bacterium]